MLSGGEFDDSFPSMMMTYYTERARKKQAQKQRITGTTQPKGMFSRFFTIFRHKRKPAV